MRTSWIVVAAGMVVTSLWNGGCTENPDGLATADIVVRGYLYAGKPVSDVQLTSSIAIGAADTVGPPITDAAVTLERNGVAYNLTSDPARSGYYIYSGSDLLVRAGDLFRLRVVRGDVQLSATTTVPSQPAGLSVSSDTLPVSVRTMFGNFKEVYSADSLVVRWDGTENDLYYTVTRCIESDPQSIVTDTLRRFDFISQPTSQLQHRIQVQNIRYTGAYRVYVYRVNQEYADLYRSRAQDTRTLNEPLTNIQNGLGVFSAFASDSVGFYVTLQ
jgi:hypothetical protein